MSPRIEFQFVSGVRVGMRNALDPDKPRNDVSLWSIEAILDSAVRLPVRLRAKDTTGAFPVNTRHSA